MQYKTRFVLLLGIGFIVVVSFFLSYSKYFFYPSLFSNQVESLTNTSKIISLNIDKALKSRTNSEPLKLSTLFADIKSSAIDKYLALNEDNAPLDYVAFYYYSKSSNVEQLFETSIYNEDVKPDYKGEDCYKVLKVPDNKKEEVSAYFKKFNLTLEKFVCRIEDHKSFVGYVIDKNAVKKYLYFRNLKDSDLYNAPNYSNIVSHLNIENILDDDNNYQLLILDNRKNIILSNAYGENIPNIEDNFFIKAQNEGSVIIDSPHKSNNIMNLSYLKDYDLYVCTALDKNSAVSSVITFNIVTILFCLVLFVIGIYLTIVFFNIFDKDRKYIENTLDILSANIFKNQIKADLNIEKLRVNNIRCNLLHPLVESIIKLCQNITENISNKFNTAQEEHKQELVQIVKKTKDLLISSMHANLMPINSDMPHSNYLDIASFIQPSGENPSDFYDIFRVDKDNIGVIFGTCEPGGEVAIPYISLSINYLKSAIIHENKLPGYALTCLNKMMMLKERSTFKMELFVIILSENTGNFIYSSGGNLSPIHIQNKNKYEILNKDHLQPLLCTNKDHTYTDAKGKFQVNDNLLFANHGIDKVKNKAGKEFGLTRIIEIAQQSSDKSASDQLINLYRSLKEYSNETENSRDICGILIKRNEPKTNAEEAMLKE